MLEPTVFLSWCSTQACLNLQYNLPISQDTLTGHGQYIDPVFQGTIGQWAYFQQITDLAFKDLKKCTPVILQPIFITLSNS